MITKKEIDEALKELFEAEWEYGCGFETTDRWLAAYNRLFKLRFGVDRSRVPNDYSPELKRWETLDEGLKKITE